MTRRPFSSFPLPLCRFCLVFALLSLFFALPAGAAAAGGWPRLWSAEELAGRPEEKRQGPTTLPDLSPPARTTPLFLAHPLPPGLSENIRSVTPAGGRRLVALTFDCCELTTRVAGYDGGVVDALRTNEAKATFYVGGKWMRSHPERAKQLMADPLFELGSHAWTHGNFGVLTPDRMVEQIDWAEAQYEILRREMLGSDRFRRSGLPEQAIAPALATFRLPYGRCTPQALRLLADHGLPAVQWSVVAPEGPHGSGEAVARHVLAHVQPGAIVLFHANGLGGGTAEALPLLIPELRRRGFELVTISELLASGSANVVSDCYFERPGDNLALDAVYGDGTRHPQRHPAGK